MIKNDRVNLDMNHRPGKTEDNDWRMRMRMIEEWEWEWECKSIQYVSSNELLSRTNWTRSIPNTTIVPGKILMSRKN